MTSLPINSTSALRAIKQTANQEVNGFSAVLWSQIWQVTSLTVAESHKFIFNVYEKLQQTFQNLEKRVQSELNKDEQEEAKITLGALENKASSALTLFNSWVTTKHPTTAAIKLVAHQEVNDFKKAICSQIDQITPCTAAESHKLILSIYEKLQTTFKNLGTTAQEKLNGEEQTVAAIALSQLDNEASSEMIKFNNWLLTNYPTTAIDYGRPCVGPFTEPKIETKNPQLLTLLAKHASMREIRGDGNCFLSAFIVRFIENLIQNNTLDTFIILLDSDLLTSVSLKNAIKKTLEELKQNPAQKDNILQNNQKVLPLINYFRQIAARELKENPDAYSPFLLSDIQDIYNGSIDQPWEILVNTYVLEMGRDFCHPMMQALCNRLEFPVKIIDPSNGSLEGLHLLEGKECKAVFCLHDKHYFVLYTQVEIVSLSQSLIAKGPTEIFVKCSVPFGHNLFIRGSGNGLSWEKGLPLTQIDEETWVFRSKDPLGEMGYKFLFDDEIWEEGENRCLTQGHEEISSPKFNIPASAQVHLDDLPPSPPVTQITVKYDAGYGNTLTLRGTGPGMDNWSTRIELRNIGGDTWVCELQTHFEKFKCKILLNEKFETGPDHEVECGKKEEIVPKF